MMPVNHVQSRVCHVTVLADADSLPQSMSNRMLTAVDLTATGVIVNKHFLNVTYSLFNDRDFLHRSQIGFLPNSRTTDNIFTIHTLIDKELNIKKGLCLFR